jgi:hypothetical protein
LPFRQRCQLDRWKLETQQHAEDRKIHLFQAHGRSRSPQQADRTDDQMHNLLRLKKPTGRAKDPEVTAWLAEIRRRQQDTK